MNIPENNNANIIVNENENEIGNSYDEDIETKENNKKLNKIDNSFNFVSFIHIFKWFKLKEKSPKLEEIGIYRRIQKRYQYLLFVNRYQRIYNKTFINSTNLCNQWIEILKPLKKCK